MKSESTVVEFFSYVLIAVVGKRTSLCVSVVKVEPFLEEAVAPLSACYLACVAAFFEGAGGGHDRGSSAIMRTPESCVPVFF